MVIISYFLIGFFYSFSFIGFLIPLYFFYKLVTGLPVFLNGLKKLILNNLKES